MSYYVRLSNDFELSIWKLVSTGISCTILVRTLLYDSSSYDVRSSNDDKLSIGIWVVTGFLSQF